MQKTHVLVVDDEPSIRTFVGAALRLQGYDVALAADGQQALEAIHQDPPNLVILDIIMPNMDGLEACRRIRQSSQVPIIMLSALANDHEKVRLLRLGADDYLAKPFSLDELLARVEAVLRRFRPWPPAPDAVFAGGDVRINFAERRVTVAGKGVELTPKEFMLLQELAANAGKVLTHDMLLKAVWGPEYGQERDYVRVYISKLRKKLEPGPGKPSIIRTVSRVGYRVEPPPGP